MAAITPGNVLIRFDTANAVLGHEPRRREWAGGKRDASAGWTSARAPGRSYVATVTTGAANNSTVRLYALNTANAQATFIGATAAGLAGAADTPTGFDAVPTAEQLRYVNSSTDENSRLNPVTGLFRPTTPT